MVGLDVQVHGWQAKIAMKASDKDGDGKLSKEEVKVIFNYFVSNAENICGE